MLCLLPTLWGAAGIPHPVLKKLYGSHESQATSSFLTSAPNSFCSWKEGSVLCPSLRQIHQQDEENN